MAKEDSGGCKSGGGLTFAIDRCQPTNFEEGFCSLADYGNQEATSLEGLRGPRQRT